MKPDLADKIAEAIFRLSDGPTPCQRLQFMGGKYPDAEIAQGGLCQESLASAIREVLSGLVKPKKRRTKK